MFRVLIFLLGLTVFSILESFFSYRVRSQKRIVRWPSNVGLIFISSFLVKIFLPGGLALFSEYTNTHNLGLFNLVDLGVGVEIFLSILVLDFFIYFQHVLSHRVPLLWRFHRVHHTDTDLDVTSALRFHPLEILFSILFKVLLVLAFGFSIESLFIFEVTLNFMAMFNHSNLYIPKKIERLLRSVVVTPQMHLIHHSVQQKESDMNYGFNLSAWDRIFQTYLNEFESIGEIGQNYAREEKEHRLIFLLVLPFKRKQ